MPSAFVWEKRFSSLATATPPNVPKPFLIFLKVNLLIGPFSYHTSGGKDLAFHLADSQVTKKINSQKWDFIILQEQSQKSGLGGKFSKSFHESVASFSKLIFKAGAIPSLYLTWEEKNGDKRNSVVYPTYEAMQKKISSAYLLAGDKNKARILPVGFAYTEVKKKEPGALRKTLQK